MADSLGLCRDYTIHNRDIKEEEDDVIFENIAWPKDSKTNYVIWGSEKNGSTKEYYPLKSIVYFLKNANMSHAQFVRQSAAANIPCIRLPDRGKLLDYLHGRITTCDSIDHSVPLDITQRRIIESSATQSNVLEDSNNISNNEISNEPPAKRICTEENNGLVSDLALDATQQRLAAKLDLPPGGKLNIDGTNNILMNNNVNNLPAAGGRLNLVLSEDKLQMLRAKFRAKHQTTIKTDDEERAIIAAAAVGDNFNVPNDAISDSAAANTLSNTLTTATSVPAKGYSAAKLQLGGASKHFVKEIISREYTWRTRNSVLQSQRKTFFDSVVMGVLKSVKLKEENLHGHGHHNLPIITGGGGNNKINMRPGGPHTPFMNPGDNKMGNAGIANGTNSSGLMKSSSQNPGSNIMGNNVGNNQNPATPGATAPTHYSRYDQERFTGAGQDTAGFKIDTMGSYHGKGLSSMMTNDGNTASRDPRRQQSGGIAAGYRNADSSKPGSIQSKIKPKSRIPIIIIPAAPTSLITMFNARDILQELKFERTEDKKSAGCRRDNELLIQRQKSDGRTVPYRIIDQPTKLNREDWDRVVAVFVQGPAWQFKNWPIGKDPVEIFSLVKAFHLKWAHMPTHADVEKWNVHVIQLDNRRHLDKANFQRVWDILDRHMIKMKPHLRF